MPHDSRPVSKGGNRGIDDQFSRAAPPGKFRVVGVDTFDGTDWVEDDFDTKELAIEHAEKKAGTMLKMHVYDDQGEHLAGFGTV